MQKLILLFIASIIGYNTFGQKFSGTVISKSDNLPLQYVNVGVLNKAMGTITNTEGRFTLECAIITPKDSIRISIIGFVGQTYLYESLKDEQVFELIPDSIELNEIVIHDSWKFKEIGTKSKSKHIVTGWAGYEYGDGGERGLKVKFKEYPINLKELNFFIANNEYDSILFRLHIRSLKDNLPDKELLKENILIPVNIKTGSVNFNLENYNLWIDQDVALTLEWINAWGICKNDDCLLLSLSLLKGTMYAKDACHANWILHKRTSTGIYLKIGY